MSRTSRPARKAVPWKFVAVGALLLAAVGAFAWGRARREAPVRYATVAVTRGDVVRAVTATGTVNPVLTIIVGSYVSGVIQSLSCDYNTRVTQGQVCAKIDPRPYQTVVDQDHANLETALAQLAKDRASLAYAKVAYDRNVRMVATGAVTQDAVDESRSEYDQASAQVVVDSSTIDQRQAELQSAQINLGYTDIVSPVTGTVVSRNVTMGQTVAASFQTPTLFLIATDLTRMEVDGNVSESDIGSVKRGDVATFTVEAFPSRRFSGTVTQVRQSPLSVQNVVTYDVVIDVPNRELLLMPGMTATTRIETARRDGVLRISDAALRYSPDGVAAAPAASGTEPAPHAWVMRGGRPVRVALVTGLDDDSFTEVLSGELRVGDVVIVSEQSSPVKTGASAPPPHIL